MNYQNTNRKQDLELKLMIEQYNKMESSLEKVLDLEESIPLMIKDMKENQSDWLKKANENLNQEMNNNKEALIKSSEKLMTEASTLLINISNLETKIKDNTKVLDSANNIVTNFNTESKNVLENIRDKYRENFWKNLLKVGGISFILNGIIIGFFLWVTNLNYNKKLIVRESKIYEKLMQIDRVQR